MSLGLWHNLWPTAWDRLWKALSMYETMCLMTAGDIAHALVCDHCDRFPLAILLNVWQALHWLKPPSFAPIHEHKLKVVWAGLSHRLAVGTATSAILANICCTSRGHSEWVLIPTQPCCGRKHSFLLVSADKQGQALLLVTCRQLASWKHQECCRLRGPQLCHGPLWLCRRVWPPASAPSCHHWSSWMDLGFKVNERWREQARWCLSASLIMLK